MSRALEFALDRYRDWLIERGVSRKSRNCLITRLRRFAEWFRQHYGAQPLPARLTGQAAYYYREYLLERGLAPSYISSLIYPVRSYHTWAVETGQLDEPLLPPMRRPRPRRPKEERPPPTRSVPFFGKEQYLAWAPWDGIGPQTLRHYRGTLFSISRWLRDSRGRILCPEDATLATLTDYYAATNRSRTSYDSVRAALHSYARWPASGGILDVDPFVSPPAD
jgi:hypothetical protein